MSGLVAVLLLAGCKAAVPSSGDSRPAVAPLGDGAAYKETAVAFAGGITRGAAGHSYSLLSSELKAAEGIDLDQWRRTMKDLRFRGLKQVAVASQGKHAAVLFDADGEISGPNGSVEILALVLVLVREKTFWRILVFSPERDPLGKIGRFKLRKVEEGIFELTYASRDVAGRWVKAKRRYYASQPPPPD